MLELEVSLLFAISLLIAVVSSLIGLGGGVFLVPILVLGFGFSSQKAIGVSLFTITFTTLSATIGYARQRKIDYRVGLLLDVLDVPGAALGAYVTTILDSKVLATLFGAFLFFVATRLLRGGRANDAGGPQKPGSLHFSRRLIASTLAASFASGVVAGMLGAGGGTVDETVMILVLGMPTSLAAGTAEFGMIVTNLSAVLPHWIYGNIPLDYVVPLALGALIGAQIGPHLSKRAQESTIRKILGAAFIVIGARMLIIPYIPS